MSDGLRTLLDGRGLVESPRWHSGRLYFSDWSAGEVLRVDLDGRHEVVARVDSLPLCTAWLPDGRLVIVSSRDGLLLRREPDGSLATHADLGRPGWNDVVADGALDGTVRPVAAPGPRRLRLRARRPARDDPVHHRRAMARHDRCQPGHPGQRPGTGR
jgi:hypothetical protein